MSTRRVVSYHFGPGVSYVGGIASVIANLVELQLGADSVHAVPTWQPGSQARSGLLAVRAIFLVLRLPRVTAVHVHLSERGSFVREAAILAVARLRRMPRVATIHGYHFRAFSQKRPRLVSRVLRMAEAVIVLSDADLDVVTRLAPTVHVELLPHPMRIDDESGLAGETAEIVLFAGEVGRRKGADVLHRAWKTVAIARPEARCIIVGPKTDLELAPIDRLQVCGPVAQATIRDMIRAARVIALPSRGEALPMILSEALAAGRPFVSTPTGGVTSLSVGGVLVPVGDAESLADALIGLLADPDLANRLGGAGRELCRDWMSPAVVDARLRVLYLLGRSG